MKDHSKSSPPSPLAMDLLIREILFSFFRLNAIGERLFAPISQTPGKMSLMRSLMEKGPQSVAQIARSRPVARQGVQRMADELAAAGLIEYVDNPSHRRAKLARLTVKGQKLMDNTMATELRWTARLARNFDGREIAIARDVIGRLMTLLAEERHAGGLSGKSLDSSRALSNAAAPILYVQRRRVRRIPAAGATGTGSDHRTQG